MEYTINHNAIAEKFEIKIDNYLAYIEYRTTSKGISIIHTIVPKELEGKGIGSALAKHILDYAMEKGLKVIPVCPFVKAYIERHKEYMQIVISEK